MLIGTKDAWETFPLKDKISYEEFDTTVKSILKICRDKIIDGHKVVTPVGKFAVKERARDFYRPSVNIVKSMERKQELIDQGITPYKAYKDENGKITGDNGGEQYFVYFTEDSFFYITVGNRRFIDVEGNSYKFTPAASTDRLRRKRMKEDDLIKLTYAQG